MLAVAHPSDMTDENIVLIRHTDFYRRNLVVVRHKDGFSTKGIAFMCRSYEHMSIPTMIFRLQSYKKVFIF